LPTQAERRAIDAFFKRNRNATPAPKIKRCSDKGGAKGLNIEHTDPKIGSTLMSASLGVSEAEALSCLVGQVVNAVTKGKAVNTMQINEMLSLVQGIAPRDPIEAMLAVQMVAVHNATMSFARRLNHVENIQQQDSASNAFNKLARTFAAQVEALNRHRGKGQQAIRVEHVTVNAGGQAIVGNVQGAGEKNKIVGQAYANQDAAPKITTLPSPDPARDVLPIASGEWQETMQDARRS